jgi:cellulose synthase/poly-beta-1,6-N-acetylglucosamine synthase-like glycosyltransferase
MPEFLLFSSVVLIVFSYLGYPVSLYVIGLLRKRSVKKGKGDLYVTIIITAHNEEKRIEEKLKNTLALNYRRERLQVLVASDGSTDLTNEIIIGYRQSGIELLAIEKRGGKENAQKQAVKHAKGDVIVFTDVATMIERTGLEEIVSNFADPSVGCVSSEDRLLGEDGQPSGEGLYVRYEMWLRGLESAACSLVGLSGSFFAARRSVCEDFSENMQSDFRTVLNSIKMGLRGVSDPKAVGYYKNILDESQEFERKVRTILRGLTVYFRHLELLNIFKYGIFSYQYFCHKLLRWLVPAFLFIAFFSNAILCPRSWYYTSIFVGQVIFYVLAFWGWKSNIMYRTIFLKVPVYFLMANASIFIAWTRYLRNQRVVMWTPSER